MSLRAGLAALLSLCSCGALVGRDTHIVLVTMGASVLTCLLFYPWDLGKCCKLLLETMLMVTIMAAVALLISTRAVEVVVGALPSGVF